MNDKLVGCIKKVHDFDKNLTAHIVYENLAVKKGQLEKEELMNFVNFVKKEYLG